MFKRVYFREFNDNVVEAIKNNFLRFGPKVKPPMFSFLSLLSSSTLS